MGLYYSGGYDWTFNLALSGQQRLRLRETAERCLWQVPHSPRFTKRSAIDHYHPAILWNDIDWPKSGKALR